MTKSCPVCGGPIASRMACFMMHFAFYEPGMLRYWRGNIKAFGWWSGLLSSIYLSFPFINTLKHWKYRKHRLVLPPLDQDGQSHG